MLRLILCTPEILEAAIKGDQDLAKLLEVDVPANWSEFGKEALEYSLRHLRQDDSETGWWTHFPIHTEDNRLIGSGGFNGKPTPEGVVEIGYEITPDYRNRGLATELAKALIELAFQDPRVTSVIAHTLGEENPSTKVLAKCGFKKVEELEDPEEGVIWKWELNLES